MTHTAEPMTLKRMRNVMAVYISPTTNWVKGLSTGLLKQWIATVDAELAKQREAHQALFTGELDGKRVGLHGTKESVEALEAYIDAKQREAEPVGEITWDGFPMIYGHKPLQPKTKLYAHQQHIVEEVNSGAFGNFYICPTCKGTGNVTEEVSVHPQQRNAADNDIRTAIGHDLDAIAGERLRAGRSDAEFRNALQHNAVDITDEMVEESIFAYTKHVAVGPGLGGRSLRAMRAALEAALSAVASRDREDAERLRKKLLDYAERVERAEPYLRNQSITKWVKDITNDLRADAGITGERDA